jgi:AraC family transcriptional regulator, transcriptional activator of pobA
MTKKIPTYSICNLLGADRCMTEFLVMPIRTFMDTHGDLYFPHRHDFFQMVLFTRGGGKHSIDFTPYEVIPRQVYYMSPGQIHTWEFEADTDGFIVNFHESFFSAAFHNPHYVREFPLFNTVSGQPLNILAESVFEEVVVLFQQMVAEFESPGDFKMDMLRSLLTATLVKLSRVAPNTYKSDASRHHLVMMRQFEKLIELHFHEKRLPKAYAEMLFISPNHLNALTNTMTGKSAGDLIRDRVLLEAKRLLVNSDLLVSQIADRLNFEDNAYFTRFFKKYTGVTPEGFRMDFARTVDIA